MWSPDSSRIVYSSDRNVRSDLYVRRADGAGEEELLLKSDQLKFSTDWSRDGRYVLFDVTESRTAKSDLWLLDLTTGQPRQLTSSAFDELGGRLSPDGRWIAYISDESGSREIYVTSFPTFGVRQQISSHGTLSDPTWTNGGRELVYYAPDGKAMTAAVSATADSIQVAAPQPSIRYPRRGFIDVTADGQRFLVHEPPASPNVPLTLITNWH